MVYSVKDFALQGGAWMFEKNLSITFLLDRYGDVLNARHRTVLDYYYNQDLSLAEIAAEVGISRQGVRDSIKKAEEELFFLEEKLHLQARAEQVACLGERLLAEPLSGETRQMVERLLEMAGGMDPQN